MQNLPDSFPNPIPHKQLHPSLQFLTFIGITIGAIIAGSLVGVIIIMSSFGMDTLNDIMALHLDSHRAQNALWILQLTGTTLPLLLTPMFFAYVVVREPDDYLKTTFHFPWLLIVIVFLCMLSAMPVIEFFGNINEKMVLPKFLSGVQKWMRDSEDQAQKMSDAMMQMKTFGSMIFDLLFIGLLTAIVEEFMFRGCLQTIFIRWVKNPHVAVWVTAILFSAFHLEFFGFLPRLILGVLFGYFTVWSGSVWPSVWAHFVNNGSIVVLTYLAQVKIINIDPNDSHTFNSVIYIIGFIITLFLLLVYRRIANRGQIADIDGEELD